MTFPSTNFIQMTMTTGALAIIAVLAAGGTAVCLGVKYLEKMHSEHMSEIVVPRPPIYVITTYFTGVPVRIEALEVEEYYSSSIHVTLMDGRTTMDISGNYTVEKIQR